MKESIINVMYASDDNFAEVLGVSIKSLICSTKSLLNIFVINQGILDINIEFLNELVKRTDHQIHFLDMPDFNKVLDCNIDISRYSMSMFSRLMVSTLLPEDIQRVIYLDCDTMVCEDLSELFKFNLNERTIGAVNDLRNIRYMKNLGIKNKGCYINSGVLLIDVEKYRRKKYMEMFLKAIKKYNGLLEFPDNDLICMLMYDDITLLPLKYNVFSIVYACKYNELKTLRHPSKMPIKEEYQEALSKPVIVHFTTCVFFINRPWNSFCNHPLTEKYQNIRSITPWGKYSLRRTQVTGKVSLEMKLIGLLPKKISEMFFGIIHAYCKPTIQYFTKKRYRKMFSENGIKELKNYEFNELS